MRTQYIVLVILVASAFAVGRYSVQFTESTEVKVDETVRRDKDVKTIKTEVVVKDVDGKETKTTVTETEAKTITTKEKETSKIVESGVAEVDKYSVNVLIGVNKDALSAPIYGFSASKKFIGPLSLGLWGLTNMTGGLSVGWSF